MSETIKRNYIIGEPEGFPEVSDGQVLYDSKGNKLYIDIDNERKLVNEKPEINSETLDNSSALPTSEVVKTALDDANAWKSDGNPEDVLSKDSEGNLSWVKPESCAWNVVSLPKYGVEWDYTNSSPKLTRTLNATDFDDPVPATAIDGTGSSPFDNIAPWSEMKVVNILPDGSVVNKGEAGFDATANDTMVWIPEFWYKAYKDEANSKWAWSICPKATGGYKKHPGSGRYVSRYHLSGDSSAVYSKSGAVPFVNVSQADFRTYVKNKGTGWYMLDIATWSAIQLLYLVEYADFDAHTRLGNAFAYQVNNTGGADSATYHTVSQERQYTQYRNIEYLCGNVMNWLDGFLGSTSEVYIGTDDGAFDGTIAGGLTKTAMNLPGTNNEIKNFWYDADYDWAFIPSETTEDSMYATYTTDLMNATAELSPCRTGKTYNGSMAFGMFRFDCDLVASTGNGSVSARAIYIPQN